MPAQTTPIPGLKAIARYTATDPGLVDRVPQAELRAAEDAAILMNGVLVQAMRATGANGDRLIDAADLRAMSDHIRGDAALYADFVEGHGDDEGAVETGYHLAQGDGGTLRFQGRDFVDTVADAIYHVGFAYRDGRFRNEDGDENERVEDVAGWLNWFVNGVNVVFGGAGAETLHSGTYSVALDDAASERFLAGAGDDSVWAGRGDDDVRAGAGHDVSGGGDGADLMLGGTGNDSLYGEAGDDRVSGQDGDDVVQGGDGDDRLAGGAGADVLGGGVGRDVMTGNAGADSLYGDEGDDLMAGGDHHDVLGGGVGDDRMIGGTGDDSIWGQDGDDRMAGQDGADRMGGGAGDDRMRGDGGADTLSGEGGADLIDAGDGDDAVYAGAGDDRVAGGDGNDGLYGDGGRDVLRGEAGDDTVAGGMGDDVVRGGDGADTVRGNGGDDRLMGDAGADHLAGGEGRDRLIGGAGADTLTDWEEVEVADIFAFATGDTGTTAATRDVVEGFTTGVDRIDLRGFGDLAFTAADTFAGTGRGQVRFDGDFVRIDADGNGTTDAMIELRWVDAVAATDFVL